MLLYPIFANLKNNKMAIPDKYNPQETEQKWYSYWLENKFFHSEPNDKPPYTIVIPPPNVTGILHMGHMLNNTIQDVLVRRARMKGFNACWVPGTDHASIATEAKVVAKLKEQGVSKSDITREEFLKHAWDWTNQYGGTILEQLKKLGCSCDWDRTRFTLEDKLSQQVIKSFVDLYNKGLIYRGYRMVNWDPEAKTNISDEEVIFKEQNGKLYFLKYQIEGSEEFLTVATTRPETIFGDVAICINPNDERYAHLKGKKAIVPIVNRAVPIIEDDYVDIEFGTGALKITPAHDVNDYEIGQKHSLPMLDILDDDANLNEHGLHYEGKNRFEVRKAIAKELEEKNLLLKAEDYVNKVGTSERTGAVIEPKISQQWFLKMSEIAKPALDVVMNDEIKFHPEKFKNTYKHWMENIRDWNISRQLWWGQRIPAYYYGDGENDFVVAENIDEALKLAKAKNPSLEIAHLRQDEDALDTWFSSWLWPMSVFDGLLDPENKDINYYYPTADLVTGPDIIFFWVARMIMAGYEYRKTYPFKHVYFTGIVRDKLGRKMSKSLGNSPDPLELIDKYGADGVRMGMMLSAPAGNDILFDESLCEQGRNFNNKIWNAFRLVQGWETADVEQPEANKIAIKWFDAKLKEVNSEMGELFKSYRISEALMTVYKLFWDEFSSWYLEMIKPEYGKPIDKQTYVATLGFFDILLKMLHPFMPFITEELWQHIFDRNEGESIMLEKLELALPTDKDKTLIAEIENVKQIVGGIRTVRNQKNIAPKVLLSLEAVGKNNYEAYNCVIVKMANLKSINVVDEKSSDASAFMVGTDGFAVPLGNLIDVKAEIEKLEKELAHLEGFLKSVKTKLSNEKFVAHAPEAVIAKERKKQSDSEEKIETIKANIEELRKK